MNKSISSRAQLIAGVALTAAVFTLLLAGPALAGYGAGSVGTVEIVDRGVKAVDIAAGAVKAAKIAAGAVTSAKIANGTVQAIDLADGAVTSAKIANGTITGSDIADGAIAAAKITGGAWTAGNDGPGSGLDADLLDGRQASDFVGTAGNQSISGTVTAAGFSYDATRTRYLTVPVAAFSAWDSSTTFEYEGWGNFEIYATGTGAAFFQAPVYLPDGAVVKNVRWQVWDADPTYNFQGTMWYGRNSDAWANTNAYYDYVGNDPSWVDLNDNAINEPVIDNQKYGYLLQLRLRGEAGNALKARAVTITYEVGGP